MRLEETFANIDSVIRAYQLDKSGQQAVVEAYAAFREHHGKFITSIAAEMLPDLKRDAEQGKVITFLGRDGHSFAAATRALDPQFFADHCTEVVLSRTMADAAIQDLEAHREASFPQIEGFRRTRNRVAESDVQESHRNLTSYLMNSGVPVGSSEKSVTLVDSSFKGTVQELLSAAYPKTQFTGRYAFYGQWPDDPNPGTKTGYVVHLNSEETYQGRGIPFKNLPDSPDLTFACNDAIGTIEDTLHGPLDSPVRISATGPVQTGQANNQNPQQGFNPTLIPERFRSPQTLEAIKATALLAVYDSATEAASMRDSGEDWKGHLEQGRATMVAQTRAWIRRDTAVVDPTLATVLDSTVGRRNIGDLAKAVSRSGISENEAQPMWQRLSQMDYEKTNSVAVWASKQATKEELSAWVGKFTKERNEGVQAARSALHGMPAPSGKPDKSLRPTRQQPSERDGPEL